MRAVYLTKYCAPEMVPVTDRPIPEVGPEEILIRVMATTVNRTDCALVTGKPLIMRLFAGLTRPAKPIPGTDLAGVVMAVGDKVIGFSPGDRIFAFNDMGLNAHAQYASISSKEAIMHMPDGMSFAEAAASVEGAHYAYNFLNKVLLKPGQTALVNGAGGAIGSALLQMFRYHGIQVTATCTPDVADRIYAMGAHKVIDHTSEDFTRINTTFDYVFDAVGKSSFGRCKNMLNPKGIYISSELGRGSQNVFLALITPLLFGKKVIFPIPSDIPASMRYIMQLFKENAFHPLMDKTYTLEKIAEAYAYVASGKKLGNVVILPNNE